MLQSVLGRDVEPEQELVADTIGEVLRPMTGELVEVVRTVSQLPNVPDKTPALLKLRKAAEDCLRARQAETVGRHRGRESRYRLVGEAR